MRQDTCCECRHFVDDPAELERAFPGILALSSGQGSTRGRCGICSVLGTFQDPVPACPDFRARSRPIGDSEVGLDESSAKGG